MSSCLFRFVFRLTELSLTILVFLICSACSMKKNASESTPYQWVNKPEIEDSTQTLETKVIRHLAYHVVLKTYQDLASHCQDLKNEINKMNFSDRDHGTLIRSIENSQQAWRNCRVSWERSEGFLFGPVESLGLDPKIDSWPINLTDLEKILASPRPIQLETMRNLSTNLQGFHAVEYFLFKTKNINEKQSPLTDREIEYLKVTTERLSEFTQQLSDAWEKNQDPDRPSSPGYVITIMNPGPHNPIYPSVNTVIAEYFSGISSIIDEVANGKIADPLGENLENANVMAVESPFSGNSINDFANNIESVQSIYTGSYGNRSGPGLYDLVAQKDRDLANQAKQQIDTSIKKIQEMGWSENIDPVSGEKIMKKITFEEAIKSHSGRKRSQEAIESLHVLLKLFERKVLPLMNL